MRHPGPRLPAPALRRLRPRQAGRLQLQTARLLPVVRGPAHGTDGGAPGGPRHPPCAGAPVGPLSDHPAAPAARSTAQAGYPVLQVVHRVIARFLLKQAGVKADEADSGAVTLIQRFGSAGSSRTWVCRRVHRLGSLLVARPCRRPDDSDSSPFGWPTEQGDGDRLRARVFGTDGCGAAPRANP